MPIWNRDKECMPVGRLRELQLERLRGTVSRCLAGSGAYREKLSKAGVTAEDIRRLDDLRQLPFTTPAELEASYPLGMLAAPIEEIACTHSVTAQDGKPCVAAYTQPDLEVWAELSARVLSMAGVKKSSVVQVAFDHGLLAESFGMHLGVERIGARLMPDSVSDKRRQAQLIADLGTTHLACTPRYALHVIDAAASFGMRLGRTRLEAGILGGEPWSERLRQQIESGLGAPTFDHYGPAEILPAAVAAECDMRDGLHLFQDHIIAEVVKPDSGEPVEAGATGELVITTLTLTGSPVLRYRTGDRTTITHHPCACGRTFARMGRITSRAGQPLLIRGTPISPERIEQVLTDAAGHVPPYQVRCDPREIAEDIELRIEVTPRLLSDAMRNLRALEARVRDHFLRTLTMTVRVRFVEPGALPEVVRPSERIVYAS